MKKPDPKRLTFRRPFIFSGLIILSFLLFNGCFKENMISPEDLVINDSYRFFVAGHVYGHPLDAESHFSPYPPFVEKWPSLEADSMMEFGVFTGDLVRYNTADRYDSLESYLDNFDMVVHKVPGNHDIVQGPEMDYSEWNSRFGPSFHSFRSHGDLFLFLDSNIDFWRISGPQIEMIRNELMVQGRTRNIFAFVHHVLWWDEDPGSVHHFPRPNATFGRHDTLNFWNELIPLLSEVPRPLWIFSGDVNAWCMGSPQPLSYYQEKNLHLITSGMGCASSSNYLVVEVKPNEEVEIRVVALGPNGENALGDLEDYSYP